MGQRLGSLIAAIGGIVLVLVNSGPLGTPISIVLRVLGVALFAAAVWYAIIRTRNRPAGSMPPRSALRTYWLCVIAEVVAIPVGAQLLIRVFDRSDVVLVWVVFVVGAHFLPFARAFQVPLFTPLAVGLMVVAVIGAVITLLTSPLGAPAAGVTAGFLLLIFAARGGSERRAAATAR